MIYYREEEEEEKAASEPIAEDPGHLIRICNESWAKSTFTSSILNIGLQLTCEHHWSRQRNSSISPVRKSRWEYIRHQLELCGNYAVLGALLLDTYLACMKSWAWSAVPPKTECWSPARSPREWIRWVTEWVPGQPAWDTGDTGDLYQKINKISK